LWHWYVIREPFSYFAVSAQSTVWWEPDDEDAVAKEAVIIEHYHNCGVFDYGHIIS
jgi:hypothetical protein